MRQNNVKLCYVGSNAVNGSIYSKMTATSFDGAHRRTSVGRSLLYLKVVACLAAHAMAAVGPANVICARTKLQAAHAAAPN